MRLWVGETRAGDGVCVEVTCGGHFDDLSVKKRQKRVERDEKPGSGSEGGMRRIVIDETISTE